MNYEYLCMKTCSLAHEVGAFVKAERKNFKTELIETKGKNDFVTYLDKASEARIVDGLSKILPGSGFIAEEQTSTLRSETHNWIIDPIDGTTNFIHGLPPHAISIALMEGNEIVIGVVYEMALDECFYSYKDGPAFLNKAEISVSKTPTVADSLIATGFPYTDFTRMESSIELMRHFFKHSHGLRRIGSAATDLVYVACGRFDAFYEYGLKPWDVAAGAYIVQQAGGRVCDFSGDAEFLFGGEIIATNLHIFGEMKNIVGSLMKTS